jgi:hypothetical protein
MIRPKRVLHRVMWTALAIIIPVLYVAALSSRPEMPSSKLERWTPPTSSPKQKLLSEMVMLEGSISIRVLSDPGVKKTWLTVTPAKPITSPNLLLYWSSGEVADGFLLGSVGGLYEQHFPAPEAFDASKGSLILYSLGHQKELDRKALVQKRKE